MTQFDLTDIFLTKQQHKPVEVGRYSISRLWGVLNHYCSLEDFLKGETISFKSALQMKMGVLKHDLIQELLPDWKIEVKTEYKYKDFVIVGKCDASKDDTILEIKTSDKLIETAKRWHEWQVKMYLSMFKKEKGIIVQPIITSSKLFLKEIGVVKRDDLWFKKELLKIEELHNEIKTQKEKEKV